MAIRRSKKVAALNNHSLNARDGAAQLLPTMRKKGRAYKKPSSGVQTLRTDLTRGAKVQGIRGV